MYRLSIDSDLTCFIGVNLLQVCVGVNELILNFENDVIVTVLSRYSICTHGGEPTVYDDTRAGLGAVVALLHDVVVRACATDAGGLLLEFRGGTTLTLFDGNDRYESFWIKNGASTIVV